MASALRRLFRSRTNNQRTPEDRAGPKRLSAVRRIFGCCTSSNSPRNPRKDSSRISPAEGAQAPIILGSTAGDQPFVLKPQTSNNPRLMTESLVKHNQAVRTRRLMKEYNDIGKMIRSSPNKCFEVELVNDSLYEWNVKVYQFDPDSDFSRDMQQTRTRYVLLNLTFPENFPFAPPFLRVISPQIEKGFVMEGGAICMELLTPRGWASGYTVEAVLMQFAASLVKGQGRITRRYRRDFNRKVAENSFKSLVKTHDKYGWVSPPLVDG